MADTTARLDPGPILQTAFGFWSSKVLLTAVEFGVFTELRRSSRIPAPQLGRRAGHAPARHRRFLRRARGDEAPGSRGRRAARDLLQHADRRALPRPQQPAATSAGSSIMLNARLFKFWDDLPEALRTGKPQNETKHGQKGMFEELYEELAEARAVHGRDDGAVANQLRSARRRSSIFQGTRLFATSAARRACSAWKSPRSIRIFVCVSFDLPPVAPIAAKHIAAAGLSDRIATASGDFFKDPLPKADVITMGMILHDWNLEKKRAPHPRGLRRAAAGRCVRRDRSAHRRRTPREPCSAS